MQTAGKNTEIYAVLFKNGGGVSSLHALYGVVRVYHFDDLDLRIFSRTRMVMQVRTYLASFIATRACMVIIIDNNRDNGDNN